MGRPGSSAGWIRRPPKAAPPSRRGWPPASIALDRDFRPAAGRRPRSVARRGRAFGACCFAGKLRSPAHASGDAATRPNFRAATSTSFPTSTSTSFPTRWGCVPLASLAERISAGQYPSWGQSAAKPRLTGPPQGSGAARPSGALRAIDSSAWPRSWRTCGPRRLRRQSQPALVATYSGAEGTTLT
jgi:hypothetical protein